MNNQSQTVTVDFLPPVPDLYPLPEPAPPFATIPCERDDRPFSRQHWCPGHSRATSTYRCREGSGT